MIQIVLAFIFAFSCLVPCARAEETEIPAVLLVHDFESGELTNELGGAGGSWNMDSSDVNNSFTYEDIVETEGADGKPGRSLRLRYSVESDRPSQNGFWLKLNALDARPYDHLEFDIKGDAKEGFTNRLKLEIKKCKGGPCRGDESDQIIKGTAEIWVSDRWETVSIPLNRFTGLIDFAEPESWEHPEISRQHLDEVVFVFQDRHVSQKRGTVYLDNVRFVITGHPGPTAVDFPPRKSEKTPVKLEGLEYAKFLIQRLRGFPSETLVRKKFPRQDKKFLREIGRDTWRFFDEIVDREHGLPLDTVQLAEGPDALGEGTWIGDYTNVTNIGVYMMCVVSAFDLGFITREDAVGRLKRTISTVARMDYHESGFPYNYYDTTTLERTSYFVSLVDSAWLMSGLYVAKNAFPEVSEEANDLLGRGNLVFFYDPVERQFYHGYYEHLKVYSDYHYGTFYTEPRAASYIAIARGEVPEEHWFAGLLRTFPESYKWQSRTPVARVEKTVLDHRFFGGYYEWKNLKYVPSWGGSAFEALMPTLVLKEQVLGPEGLGLNNLQHVLGQIHYAKDELKQPVWGMSPCSVPEGGYSEYGAKPMGSKGYKAGVVTPHASVLALDYAPKAVTRNLRRLLSRFEIYGEYGFYDAVNVSTGRVARKYLALDQAMILISINNHLNRGAIRERFHAEPIMREAERLLSEEKLFEPAPKSEAA